MQRTANAGFKYGKKSYGNSTGGEDRRSQKPYYMPSKNSGRSFGPSRRKQRGESIDISLFVRKSVGIEAIPYEINNAFSDFAIAPILKQNLAKRNYKTPTPIQDQAINPIIEGRDLVGLANTGTGKTAAFLLPLINKVYNDPRQKILIIAPTRELALQIDDEFRLFSWGMRIFSAACVGGAPIFKQINNLKRNPNFVIGTPGRLKDLSERRLIKLETFNNVVVDEFDRMLDMGFIDDIREILSKLPTEKYSRNQTRKNCR
ncbi:MAG: DEAD/DEAH box helicase [Candidatus Berkelbacteria bacterium]|nr:DEAD/DEAH box helicase [Candidatus Berkelbacteria bacterium]